MNRIVFLVSALLLFCTQLGAQTLKGLQVDLRAKAEMWYIEDVHYSITTSVGRRFNDKRYLGLEGGLAYGWHSFDEGCVVNSGNMMDYVGVPLYLDYIRYSRAVNCPLLKNSTVRLLGGASAGGMLRIHPKRTYTYYGLDGSYNHYTEEKLYPLITAFPYVVLKAGLEFQSHKGSRFSLGIEAMPVLGGGLFLSYGF